MTAAARVVERLWLAFEARDWNSAARCLADDVVVDWPHSGERIPGRDNVIGLNRAYPEGWSIRIVSLVADGDRVASEVEVAYPPETFYAASFFTVREGSIQRVTEYWVTARSEEPPAWRSRFTQPRRD